MPDNTTTRGLPARLAPYALTIGGAAVAYKVSFVIWDWAWPLLLSLRDWTYELLLTLGINAADAGQIAPYSSYLLLVAIYFACGAVVGAIGQAYWRRFTILFAIVIIVAPYAKSPRELRANVHLYGWNMLGLATLLNSTALVPSSLLGAWLGSRPAKRRRERRRAAGLCEACGYSLAGNTTGICPECGLKTSLFAALSFDKPPGDRP